MTATRPVRMTLNDHPVEVDIDPRTTLADYLRDDRDLTGTHIGCGHGTCGACTVLVDGEPARSCLMLAVQADGCTVTTVEGLSTGDGLTDVQQAFNDHHAMQCGFCTPGFVVSLTALSHRAEPPTEQDLIATLDGHLCRCTGYQNIISAGRQILGLAGPRP